MDLSKYLFNIIFLKFSKYIVLGVVLSWTDFCHRGEKD